MPAVLYILFGAAFTVAVCLGAGRLLLRCLETSLDREEHWLFSFLLGAVLLSNFVFLLCMTHLARKGVFLAAGLGVLWWAWRSGAGGNPRRGPDSLSPLHYLFLGIAAAYTVLYLFNAMAPEISPDGSTY